MSMYKVFSVHSKKFEQMEEVVSKQKCIDEDLHHGQELMMNISSEEAIQLKDKLDLPQRKYDDLASKATELPNNTWDTLPLMQNAHQSRPNEWMTGVKDVPQSLGTFNLKYQ